MKVLFADSGDGRKPLRALPPLDPERFRGTMKQSFPIVFSQLCTWWLRTHAVTTYIVG